MPILLYSGLAFLLLLLLETAFVALASGHLSVQVVSPLLENAGFFLQLAREDMAGAVRVIVLEKPWFIIQSQHGTTGVTVWALHFFSFTVLVHGWLAFVLARALRRDGLETSLRSLPIAGTALLILSTLYLILVGCCRGGANWIVHTWLLAVAFNPVTANDAAIGFYQLIKDWFTVAQAVCGLLGIALIIRHKAARMDKRALFRSVL